MLRSIKACATCAHRVRPSVDPSYWAYSRGKPSVGCWVCGIGGERMVELALKLEPLDDFKTVFQEVGAGNDSPIFRKAFSIPIDFPGENWELDEEEDE